MGIAWVWFGNYLGMVWVLLGYGLGIAWVWHWVLLGYGLGIAWVWFGMPDVCSRPTSINRSEITWADKVTWASGGYEFMCTNLM